MTEVAAAVAIGLTAGFAAGMLGVGGGAFFVPALSLALGLDHLEALGTSLAAIVPVALLGAWRQHVYGNLRVREGVLLGVLAVGGAFAGVEVAHAVSEEILKWAFAALMVVTAAQLARRALSPPPEPQP